MAQTLWERLIKGPQVEYTNPVKAKIGCTFTIDAIGYRDLIFTLREIVEYKRKINGKDCNFADYALIARSLDRDDVLARVRFVPVESPDAMMTHNVILLQQYDEMKFCKELDDSLREETGELVITDNATGDEEKYWRINDTVSSYSADVTVIKENEIEKSNIEYWDFSRLTEDEAKQQYTQYLFVELDKEYKNQTMWRGEEIDPQRVVVI